MPYEVVTLDAEFGNPFPDRAGFHYSGAALIALGHWVSDHVSVNLGMIPTADRTVFRNELQLV